MLSMSYFSFISPIENERETNERPKEPFVFVIFVYFILIRYSATQLFKKKRTTLNNIQAISGICRNHILLNRAKIVRFILFLFIYVLVNTFNRRKITAINLNVRCFDISKMDSVMYLISIRGGSPPEFGISEIPHSTAFRSECSGVRNPILIEQG